MFSSPTLFLVTLFLLQVGQPAQPSPAPMPMPPAPPANTIKVSVVVILASSKDNKVEASLTALAQEVQQNIDPKLTSFRVASWTCEEVTPGVLRKLTLVEDQVLTVTLNKGEKEGTACLKVKPPLVNEEIHLCAQCGKFLPIVTSYRTKDGDQLLVALRIHPCTAPK